MAFSLSDFAEPGDKITNFRTGQSYIVPEMDEDDYADRTWNGEPNSVIESESNPWIANSAGVVDFDTWGAFPIPGVFALGTEVQRSDANPIYANDLHAAAALRDHLNATTGDTSHVVRFRGTL